MFGSARAGRPERCNCAGCVESRGASEGSVKNKIGEMMAASDSQPNSYRAQSLEARSQRATRSDTREAPYIGAATSSGVTTESNKTRA